MFNAIMLAVMLPVLFILYFMLRSEAKPRKNIVLGVTLPYIAREDPEVKGIVGAYKRQLGIVTLALILPPFAALLTKHMSIAMTIYMVWLECVLVGMYVPYIRQHRKLKALKKERGWYSGAAGKAVVDLRAAAAPRRTVSGWWFLPPAILSLVPVFAQFGDIRGNWPFLMVLSIMAALVVSCYFFYRVLYRQRAEVVDENEALTGALTRVRRHNWARFWLWMAYLSAAYSIGIWLCGMNGNAVLILSLAYAFALLLIAMRTEFAARRAQYALAANSGQSTYVDEDAHWIWGMFYYNPDDRHILINNRVGMGTTVNFARRSGQIFMGVSALLLLAMPLVGVWMMHEEFTPVQLSVTQEAVVANHCARTYTIPYDEIDEVQRMDVLPQGVRTAGTAMDTVMKGNYRLEGIGNCRVCLDPRVPPFLVIRTADAVYVVGASQSEAAEACYGEILKHMG